jgi:hypothetical protein
MQTASNIGLLDQAMADKNNTAKIIKRTIRYEDEIGDSF